MTTAATLVKLTDVQVGDALPELAYPVTATTIVLGALAARAQNAAPAAPATAPAGVTIDGLVDADSNPVAWNHLDAEAAHAAAELCEHFVAGITLHAVEPAAVHRHDRALHVDEIVLAQLLAIPFLQTNIVPHLSSGHLVIWLSGHLANQRQ